MPLSHLGTIQGMKDWAKSPSELNVNAWVSGLNYLQVHGLMKLYFAYGSNLWRKQMEDRCPEHRLISNGILKGYRWIITTRGYANVVRSTSDEVHGMVYEITESDERSLDRFEGVQGGDYRKEMLKIAIGGESKECLVYVDPVEEEGKPKREYVDRINKGISDSKIPAEYVDRYIRKFIPA